MSRAPLNLLLVLGLLLLAPPYAPASEGPAFVPQIGDFGRPASRIFTDQDGLPQNAVTSIVVDRDQYVWAGTKDGAARYDGRTWTALAMPDAAGSNWVQCMLASEDGAIWFGTLGGGLARYHSGEWTLFGPRDGLPSDHVTSLLETGAPGQPRTIWAGTMNGLARFDGRAWIRAPLPAGAEGSRISALLETVDDNGSRSLWVGTEPAGVLRRRDGAWTHYADAVGAGARIVTSLIETTAIGGRRSIVAGTFGAGLHVFDGERWEAAALEGELSYGTIFTLRETRRPDGSPVLWAGTPIGVWRYADGRWSVFGTAAGIPPSGVWSLCAIGSADGNLSLWIGTAGGGVLRWQLGRWIAFDTASGLPSNSSYSVLVTPSPDGSEALWVGTSNGGLARLENGKWTAFTPGIPGREQVSIWCLAWTPGRRGQPVVWAGTNTGGLARFEDGRWRLYSFPTELPGSKVNCLLPSRSPEGAQRLWVGTSLGIALIENGEPVPVDPAIRFEGTTITSLLETEAAGGGRALWVGTDMGLVRYESGVTTIHNRANGLPNDFVLSLAEVQNESGGREIWAGTRGGVGRLDPDDPSAAWRTLSTASAPALPNNTIYRIERDAAERIYLFTNKGVARITRAGDGELAVYVFTTEDGLPSNECNTGASHVDYRGRIWAGTIGGVAVLDPALEVPDVTPKPLRLHLAFLPALGRDLVAGESLAYDENSVLFEFALLSYFRGVDTRFRTQLVGLDAQPSDWTADGKKEYNSLPAGDYVFRVWGRDAAGNVSGPVELPFTIRRAPWLAWWAFVLYALAAVAVAAGFGRYRMLALRRHNQQLEAGIVERTAELGRLVESLRASERAAQEATATALEANRAKSVFLANMSHELRTPLNAIIGFVQLLERDRTLTAEQRETLGIVARSGDHLLALINDVLSIAKIEAGRVTLQEETLDLHRLLRSVREMTASRADAKGIALEFDLDPNLPPAVRGDEGKLRQVFINLLGNAVKFTDEGSVTLRVRWLGDRARFEVADTGVGIAPEEMGRLFQAFVQTSAGARAKEGTGLGLVISLTYVQMMGGTLEVESELGRGTTFSFEIDMPESTQEEVARRRRRARSLAAGERPRRILVVDDRLENRVLLSRLLVSVGFEVREATNGEEAIAEWREWQPELIWMDMRMPVMDGIAATRAIREAERGAGAAGQGSIEESAAVLAASASGLSGETSLPAPGPRPAAPTKIIALTASAFEHERSEYLSIGCDDFVAKPFQASTVLEKMAEHIGVRYEYDDDATNGRSLDPRGEVLTTARLSLVPESARDRLARAMMAGDVAEAQRAVDLIAEHDETLADELRAYVLAYRFEEILEALDAGA